MAITAAESLDAVSVGPYPKPWDKVVTVYFALEAFSSASDIFNFLPDFAISSYCWLGTRANVATHTAASIIGLLCMSKVKFAEFRDSISEGFTVMGRETARRLNRTGICKIGLLY